MIPQADADGRALTYQHVYVLTFTSDTGYKLRKVF